jgi:hypothetical protein
MGQNIGGVWGIISCAFPLCFDCWVSLQGYGTSEMSEMSKMR